MAFIFDESSKLHDRIDQLHKFIFFTNYENTLDIKN